MEPVPAPSSPLSSGRPTARSTPRRGDPCLLSIAPMMDRTDRHFRFFARQLTRHTWLYTEMITTGAILHGDRERLLGFDAIEHPVVLQIGGDDPQACAESARVAAGMGYDEINLNVGCPSDRVQSGNFGACLMARPERVAACVEAMRAAVSLPVTVKHRIGIDGLEAYEDLERFVDVVAAAGCDRFIVHARIAVLGGLSPKENRTIPPLRYEDVYRLKRARPELRVEINGGIRSLDASLAQLEHVDGVMIGRAAYEDPYVFADADRRVFGADTPAPSRRAVVEACFDYADRLAADGRRLHLISRHLLALFVGQRGGRRFRRVIAEQGHRPGAGAEVLRRALAEVDEDPAPPGSAEE